MLLIVYWAEFPSSNRCRWFLLDKNVFRSLFSESYNTFTRQNSEVSFFCDILFVLLKATKQNFSKRNLELKFNFRHAIWSYSREFLKFIYLKRKLVFLFIKLVRFLCFHRISLWKSHSRKTVCHNWHSFSPGVIPLSRTMMWLHHVFRYERFLSFCKSNNWTVIEFSLVSCVINDNISTSVKTRSSEWIRT